MRKDFGQKTWLYPMPVLIIGSYDQNGKANAMNAAWGGIYDYNQIMVSLSSHRTTSNIRKSGAFTISVATKKMVEACDYVGLVSQNNDEDKMIKSTLHDFPSKNVNAPLFKELPFTLECKVVSMDGQEGEGATLIGEIINISIDEEVLTNGKVDPLKLEALAFDPVNNKYLLIKDEVAEAFKVGLKLK